MPEPAPDPSAAAAPPRVDRTWRSYASLRRTEGLPLRANPRGACEQKGWLLMRMALPCLPLAAGAARRKSCHVLAATKSKARSHLAYDVALLWKTLHCAGVRFAEPLPESFPRAWVAAPVPQLLGD